MRLLVNLFNSQYGLEAYLLNKAAWLKKQRHKADLERCYQCSVGIEISLVIKFFPSNVKN